MNRAKTNTLNIPEIGDRAHEVGAIGIELRVSEHC